MRSVRDIIDYLGEWRRRWGSYTLLVLGVSQLVSWLVIPLVAVLGGLILRAGRVPFVSYDNLGAIIVGKPVTFLLLLMLFLLVLAFAYLQFVILLTGVDSIRQNERLTIASLLKRSLSRLGQVRLRDWPLLIGYFVLVIPFGRVALSTPLLEKVRIPIFVLDSVSENWWFIPVGLLLVGVTFWIAVRLMLTLPLISTSDVSFGEALKSSFQKTRHRFWYFFWRVLWITLLSQGITWAWTEGLVFLQTLLDKTSWAFAAAVLTMTLVQLGSTVWATLTTTLFLLLLLLPEGLDVSRQFGVARPRSRWRWRIRALVLVGIAFLALVFGVYNASYMTGALDAMPRVIAHRGVDGNNGVQNTIDVLERTAKNKPDYVEMDIHETKDKQFVVMHDANLKALTGIDTTPRQRTLKELTQMTVRENGHEAKMPSFDAYLEAAERLKQPLIVELKTTPQDSKDVIDLFLDRYAKRLIKDGYPVHSLDYRVVVQAKKRYPKLFVGFISPYNLMLPQTDADAYTEEQTTIEEGMVEAAQATNKKLWAWTINDSDDMRSMLFLNVDGIITDNMSTLRKVIASETAQPSYAQRLRNYANNLSLLRERSDTEN